MAALDSGTSGEKDGKRRRRQTSEVESVIAALNAGRDPVASREAAVTLPHATTDAFEDGLECGDGEARCFVLTDKAQSPDLLPSGVTRDNRNAQLLSWDSLKLLPPQWYEITFVVAASGRLRRVPEAKLLLDSYPAAPSKTDPDYMAGFKTKADLRLVLRPNALRFYWGGLHEPLRAAGAWPTAPQVMRRGFELEASVMSALQTKLGALVAQPGAEPWAADFAAALRSRHGRGIAAIAPEGSAAAPPTSEGEVAAAALRMVREQVAATTLLCEYPAWVLPLCRAAEEAVLALHPRLAPDLRPFPFRESLALPDRLQQPDGLHVDWAPGGHGALGHVKEFEDSVVCEDGYVGSAPRSWAEVGLDEGSIWVRESSLASLVGALRPPPRQCQTFA